MKKHAEISTYFCLKHRCGKKSAIFPYSVSSQKPRDYPPCNMATFTFVFLVNDRLFGEIIQLHEHWNYGAHDVYAFLKMFFAVFKNLKSSFSEDSVPVQALDVFIKKATKMVWIIPLNKKWGPNFHVAPKPCMWL